jgi:hypothetical protein
MVDGVSKPPSPLLVPGGFTPKTHPPPDDRRWWKKRDIGVGQTEGSGRLIRARPTPVSKRQTQVPNLGPGRFGDQVPFSEPHDSTSRDHLQGRV